VRSRSLFYEADLRDALEGHARTMDKEIAEAPEGHLMQADEDEWVAALVERYSVDAPQLQAEQWWQDAPAEIKYDVSGHPGRDIRGSGPFYVNGIRVVVHVPFTGEADLFKFTPNTRDWNPPTADIRSGEVLVAVEYPADSPIDVRATAQGVIDKINKYLGWARNDAEQFNRGLAQRARSAIQARRNRVREAYTRAQETGIPMRRPDESPKTYIADVLVRRPSPSIPPANVSRAIALEPVLSDEVFEHILGVIRGAGESMERSPKTYAGMGEEDRRQVLRDGRTADRGVHGKLAGLGSPADQRGQLHAVGHRLLEAVHFRPGRPTRAVRAR